MTRSSKAIAAFVVGTAVGAVVGFFLKADKMDVDKEKWQKRWNDKKQKQKCAI
jgi:hypothetical protein